MPGKHGRRKGKKGKGGFTALIGIVLVGLMSNAFAFLPHKDKSTEFRVLVTTDDFSNYEFNGQIVGGSVLHSKIKIAGLLEMDKTKSAMKGYLEYQLNDYIKLGVAGGVNNNMSGVADFMIIGHIPGGGVDFLPFLKVTHKALGEVGMVFYWTIKKVVFNVGLSYQPHINRHQKDMVTLMVGTGIK